MNLNGPLGNPEERVIGLLERDAPESDPIIWANYNDDPDMYFVLYNLAMYHGGGTESIQGLDDFDEDSSVGIHGIAGVPDGGVEEVEIPYPQTELVAWKLDVGGDRMDTYQEAVEELEDYGDTQVVRGDGETVPSTELDERTLADEETIYLVCDTRDDNGNGAIPNQEIPPGGPPSGGAEKVRDPSEIQPRNV